VRKTFGAVTALDRVDLTIEAGERVAIVGSNGSGKTTLIRAMLGLVRVEGHVLIDGVDVARAPEVALRGVAYVPQVAPPIEAPVFEVVRAHAALRGLPRTAAAEAALRLGLDLAACGAKRFRDLSGGTKQKVLAALALSTDAPIFVCDEPTANLDGAARAAFLEALARRPENGIVILCSHRSEEVRDLVHRVIELRDGRIAIDERRAPVAPVAAIAPARASASEGRLLRAVGLR
jgi:ABC-2 type transport system ATP-binding protein